MAWGNGGFWGNNRNGVNDPAVQGALTRSDLFEGFNTQVANVQSTATSSSATDFVNLSFDAVVKVMPTCCPLSDNSATFTVINSGASANYSNLTITITRV